MRRSQWFGSVPGVAAALLAFTLASPATAQPTFSIDYHGPTISLPDSITGTPIVEGDILTFPPGAPPGIVISGGVPGPLGLGLPMHPPSIGHPPGVAGLVEVDAFSYGTDDLIGDDDIDANPHYWVFSVDEFAIGDGSVPFPSVATEGAAGAFEASADLYSNVGMPFPPGPLPPGGVGVPFNTGLYDGDGVFPFGGPPLGLIEPTFPVGGLPDTGDNLDAVDVDQFLLDADGATIYFSLDGTSFDVLEGGFNSGSAGANGPFVGGDVLVTVGFGGPIAVYAPAVLLGLDLVDGAGTDDLDALVLAENGDGVYQPYGTLYDWLDGSSDLLLFSVRRGSSVIGVPDSIFGVPIEEGDILIPPPAGSGLPPGIWIAAENLGLATFRSFPVDIGDDLNALDVFHDCNANGVPDQIDVASGSSADTNGNGIPDECEGIMSMNFIRGDVDQDLDVDLVDVLQLLCFTFGGCPGYTPPCLKAVDIDGNGSINGLVEALYLLAYLYQGGPPPPPPFPNCGPDPASPLTCLNPICP